MVLGVSLELAAQFAFNGIVVGSLYAIYGTSFGLIYWTTGVFHFAHGIIYATGAYVMYAFIGEFGWPTVYAVPVAVLCAVVFAVLVELLVYRPLRNRNSPPLVSLVASLGIFYIFQNLYHIFFTADPRTLTQEFRKPLEFGPIITTWLQIGKIATAVVVLLVLLFILFRTRWGTAIRAVVDNRQMAAVVGIDINRIFILVYVLGTLLVMPASYLVLLDRGASPEMGLPALLAAAISVFVGGVRAIPAAAAAGLMLGLAENLGILYINAKWQLTISFGLLVFFLLVRPRGVFGAKERKVAI
jgi:branched-chain amino acid transport system permease protein